jgi:hypothetical protein
MKLTKHNILYLVTLYLITITATNLYGAILKPWPHARALFWDKVPMKKGGHWHVFITNPAVRAAILLKHADYRVESLIMDIPQDFARTLSPEDRYIESLRTRKITETRYHKSLSYPDPIAKYIAMLTEHKDRRQPHLAALAIQPKIFVTPSSDKLFTEPFVLQAVGPDIIIDSRKFRALGNATQLSKETQLTKAQQFLLNTTWQALASGDHYITTKLNRTLDSKSHNDHVLPDLKKQLAMITMAQKIRNDLAAATDSSEKLMDPGIHIYSQLAHQQYSRTPVIDSLAVTKIRLAALISAHNLIEGTDRRS